MKWRWIFYSKQCVSGLPVRLPHTPPRHAERIIGDRSQYIDRLFSFSAVFACILTVGSGSVLKVMDYVLNNGELYTKMMGLYTWNGSGKRGRRAAVGGRNALGRGRGAFCIIVRPFFGRFLDQVCLSSYEPGLIFGVMQWVLVDIQAQKWEVSIIFTLALLHCSIFDSK